MKLLLLFLGVLLGLILLSSRSRRQHDTPATLEGPRKEESETASEIDLSAMRGILDTETNATVLLVKAPLDTVTKVFQQMKSNSRLEQSVGGREVTCRTACFALYQLASHSWTQVQLLALDTDTLLRSELTDSDAGALSRELSTTAILYGISDTAGAIEYKLFQQGQLIENYSENDNGVEFKSTRRNDSEAPDVDGLEFVDDFLRSQDALVSGLEWGGRTSAGLKVMTFKSCPQFAGVNVLVLE